MGGLSLGDQSISWFVQVRALIAWQEEELR
jgi:hypothetical protein